MLADVGKGTVLLADSGYGSDAIRKKLEEQGARANIHPLEHDRAIATRFCRHDANYLASVQLAALHIWLRVHESVT
jgi:hypothetical protein